MEVAMNKQDVMTFVKANPACTIATVEGDQPRVRGFLAVTFDDDRVYFTTGATKNVYQQLSKNPKVELCFLTPEFGTMLRIAGELEVLDDREKKQDLINRQDYLRHYSADDPVLILLRLARGQARFWTMENNMKEDGLEVIDL